MPELNDWIRQVSGGKSRIPLDEEIRLFDFYKDGNLAQREYAKNELLAYNVLPIVNIALEVYHSFPTAHKVEVMDLVHRGVEVFLNCLDKFNPGKARLITFYTRDVKTHMQRFVMRYSTSIVQGSVYLQHLAGRRTKVRQELEQELNRWPTDKEIAERMDVSMRTLGSIDMYTSIAVDSVPGIENMNVETGQASIFDQLMDILREKFSFLDEYEFNEMVSALYFADPVDENIMGKIQTECRGGISGHHRTADSPAA